MDITSEGLERAAKVARALHAELFQAIPGADVIPLVAAAMPMILDEIAAGTDPHG